MSIRLRLSIAIIIIIIVIIYYYQYKRKEIIIKLPYISDTKKDLLNNQKNRTRHRNQHNSSWSF